MESLGRCPERSFKPLDRARVGCQIGRILAQNSRAAARYRIQVLDDPSRDAGLQLVWSVHREWYAWASHCEGGSLPRTGVRGWDAEELGRTCLFGLRLPRGCTSPHGSPKCAAHPGT